MEYFGISETIKEYRDILQVTQKELANVRLSSNLIKILESGKKRLTIPTAMLLAENINEIAEKKGILLNVGIKDLMISNQEYIEKIILKKLNEIKSEDFEIEKFDELVEKAERFELYSVLEEIYYFIYENTNKAKNYELSITYLKKLIEVNTTAGMIRENPGLYNKVGTCYFLLGSYEEASKYYNIALDSYIKNRTSDSNLKGKILYNLSLSYNKNSEYGKALKFIKEIPIMDDIENRLIYNAKILMSNIYSRMGDGNTALEILEGLLENPCVDHFLYHNIADSLYKLGRNNECLEYLEKSIKIQMNNESPDMTLSLLYSGKVYKEEKRYPEAYIYFNYAVGNANRFNQINELVEVYELCYELFSETHYNRYFENMVEGAINTIFKSLEDDKTVLKITLILLDYFMSTNQYIIAKDLILKIKEKGDF